MRYEITLTIVEGDNVKEIDKFAFEKLVSVGNEDLTSSFNNDSLKPMVKKAMMDEFERMIDKFI